MCSENISVNTQQGKYLVKMHYSLYIFILLNNNYFIHSLNMRISVVCRIFYIIVCLCINTVTPVF